MMSSGARRAMLAGYENMPCRVCGKKAGFDEEGNEDDMIYVGWDEGDESCVVHEECFDVEKFDEEHYKIMKFKGLKFMGLGE